MDSSRLKSHLFKLDQNFDILLRKIGTFADCPFPSLDDHHLTTGRRREKQKTIPSDDDVSYDLWYNKPTIVKNEQGVPGHRHVTSQVKREKTEQQRARTK